MSLFVIFILCKEVSWCDRVADWCQGMLKNLFHVVKCLMQLVPTSMVNLISQSVWVVDDSVLNYSFLQFKSQKRDVQTHKGDSIKVHYRISVVLNNFVTISSLCWCKESNLTWLWSYILRHWCCSQAILTLLFVWYTERLCCCSGWKLKYWLLLRLPRWSMSIGGCSFFFIQMSHLSEDESFVGLVTKSTSHLDGSSEWVLKI